ncbi:MAG: hypothetical protein KAS87_03985 [Candidatus Omnitrophica bacterium]|nr:hypothetical protein [Candidatus Omnitrophota bacterium]
MMHLGKRKGESLVGVLVATLLLAILAVFLANSFVVRKKAMHSAGYRIEAKNLARAKLEEFKANPSAITGLADNTYPDPANPISFNDGRSVTRQWIITTDPADADGFSYKRVNIEVNWDED